MNKRQWKKWNKKLREGKIKFRYIEYRNLEPINVGFGAWADQYLNKLPPYIEVVLKTNTPILQSFHVKYEGEVVGHAVEDSIPDPNHPGYHLVKVSLHDSENKK